MSKVLLCKINRTVKCKNGHSAKVRLCLSHIPWVHTHAKFEEDLPNTSPVISETQF